MIIIKLHMKLRIYLHRTAGYANGRRGNKKAITAVRLMQLVRLKFSPEQKKKMPHIPVMQGIAEKLQVNI